MTLPGRTPLAPRMPLYPRIGWLLNDAPGIGWLLDDGPGIASLLDDRLSMAVLVHRNDGGLSNAPRRQRSETEHQSRPRALEDHLFPPLQAITVRPCTRLTPKGTHRRIGRFKPRQWQAPATLETTIFGAAPSELAARPGRMHSSPN